jgi:S-adenosylmethionine hydrolase
MRSRTILLLFILLTQWCLAQNGALVFQTDFGLKDGAVAAMKGVAFGVSKDLRLFDLTHEIPPYNIWEAAYRLNQTAPYWPTGTVFVSVVDPGVGSSRKSVVMKTKTGHFFVSPDNGSLTLVAQSLGIHEVRQIDETKNRLIHSQESYTFHGRDVYAFTGARLASGVISFEEVGPSLGNEIIQLEYQKPSVTQKEITGMIDILDIQYGNVWTNINRNLLLANGINYGDKLEVKILYQGKQVLEKEITYGKTFSDVPVGSSIAYINSLDNFSIGINQDNFAQRYAISSGVGWKIIIRKLKSN